MSGVLKAVGKVFRKVVKVVKVVAPIALAAAAVVFTGGAALGLGLPTFSAAVGGVAASLGLGTAVTGALTGAVVSAGFGAAAGGLMSGLKGGSILKGMQGGALAGAVTGGALGALSPSTFGIVNGVDAAGNTITTTTNAIRNGGHAFAAAGSKTPIVTGADGITRVASGASPGGAPAAASAVKTIDIPPGPGGVPPSGEAPVSNLTSGSQASGTMLGTPNAGRIGDISSAIDSAGAAKAGGGGLFGTGGSFFANPLNSVVAGQMISGLFSPKQSKALAKQLQLQEEMRQRAARDAYGGVYDGRGIDAFGTSTYPAPLVRSPEPVRRYRLNPATLNIEEIEGVV